VLQSKRDKVKKNIQTNQKQKKNDNYKEITEWTSSFTDKTKKVKGLRNHTKPACDFLLKHFLTKR
jgi:hypothetical protein